MSSSRLSKNSGMIKATRNGWKYVFGGFAFIITLAAVLSVLYGEWHKPTAVLNKKASAASTSVCYAIVVSPVHTDKQNKIVSGIMADIGADTSTTEFIIGSTVADPWCATAGEFVTQLRRAMTDTPDMITGKQSLILSMITGLITKSDVPARLYVIGTLADVGSLREEHAILNRTRQSVSAISWRNASRAPVTVVSYLDTASNRITQEYSQILLSGTYTRLQRETADN